MMPTKAFVLIEIAKGEERGVIMALRKLSGVKETESVTGPYDIIAVVEGTDPDEIGSIVTSRIGGISGITRTVTCVAVDIT